MNLKKFWRFFNDRCYGFILGLFLLALGIFINESMDPDFAEAMNLFTTMPDSYKTDIVYCCGLVWLFLILLVGVIQSVVFVLVDDSNSPEDSGDK